MTVEDEIVVTGVFDDIRSVDVRFLEELSRDGPVHVKLRADAELGVPPLLPQAERKYFLESLRWVSRVSLAAGASGTDAATVRAPEPVEGGQERDDRPRVLVSGCYDWLHTGHVRFFEEVAGLGTLFVTVGSDRSVEAFKGKGHPLQPQDERLYMVRSIRYVEEALIASGEGRLDFARDIERLRPDVLVVNEDGDHEDKRAFCEGLGIRYRVLERVPKPGLPRRSSTELRGF